MTTLTDLIAEARASGCTHAPLPIEEVERTLGRIARLREEGHTTDLDLDSVSIGVEFFDDVAAALGAMKAEVAKSRSDVAEANRAIRSMQDANSRMAEQWSSLSAERDAALSKLSEAEAEIDDLLEREESLARARDEAERDRDRFREALDWYATPDNWRRWPIELARVKYGRSAPIRVSIERIVFEAPSGYALSFVEDDHGQRACRALTGEAPQ